MGSATLVADVDAPGVAAGAIDVREINGAVVGYGIRCPGCGQADYLPIEAQRGWTVTSGDARRPETVTLSPSVLHTPCGWHGYLRGGQWVSC